MVLKKTLDSPLDSKIKPVNPKGNQPWIVTGRADAEAEAPILWPPDAKSPITGNDPDAGKDWGQEKNGMPEDEMVGWHHWLNGHEFEQVTGGSKGQGSLGCCNPWGHRVRGDFVTEHISSYCYHYFIKGHILYFLYHKEHSNTMILTLKHQIVLTKSSFNWSTLFHWALWEITWCPVQVVTPLHTHAYTQNSWIWGPPSTLNDFIHLQYQQLFIRFLLYFDKEDIKKQ